MAETFMTVPTGDLLAYGGLFLHAFLAATLLPFPSEVALAGLVASDTGTPVLLVIVATVGNVLGSLVNWLLGRLVLRFRDRRWFPVGGDALDEARRRFARWGQWSLLLAWVPIIGDPLTLAAGTLGVRLVPFLLLVGIGKAARYAALAAGVLELR